MTTNNNDVWLYELGHTKVKVTRKDIKCANLKVKPSLEVLLNIPLNMSQELVGKLLLKRQDWVLQQLEYFSQSSFNQYNKKFVSGENFDYLGRGYRLKVTENAQELVKLANGYLRLQVKDKSNYSKKKRLIDSWYKNTAQVYIMKLVQRYQKIVLKDVDKISIRKMKTRWGSCNPKKSYINFNIELIKKPAQTIEYVVFHELVHLIHYRHDIHFYNYLTAYMPDWQDRKKLLNKSA